MEASVVVLPVEIISTILDCLDDPAYCAARQAHSCFRVDDTERVERRACRWRGCVTIEDFCLKGNLYAVARTSAEARASARAVHASASHEFACVRAAARGGHLDVLLLLRDLGYPIDPVVVAKGAARGGHVHLLDIVVDGRLFQRPSDTQDLIRRVVDQAYRSDRPNVFGWTCAARGEPPTTGDIWWALKCDAVAVALYCESRGAVGFDWLDAFRRTQSRCPKAMAEIAWRVTRNMDEDEQCGFACETMRRGRMKCLDAVYEACPEAFGFDCAIAALDHQSVKRLDWLEKRGLIDDYDDLFDAAVRCDNVWAVDWLHDVDGWSVDWDATIATAIKARAIGVIAWACSPIFSGVDRDAIELAFYGHDSDVLAILHLIAHEGYADAVLFLLGACMWAAPGMPQRPEVVDAIARCVETGRRDVIDALYRNRLI
ncbi:hypothetical protein psal_cds_1051 [Pandoravirus salinus]|uniref:Ankyrin repeat domain containing protein n=1 Tax=Pandoravirus salinus TaxID=1349410 RepID=S4W0D5_9VIRU|nr:hypothetical protein psal_cds_1051 [Pandoravirus salinus]AGO85251.1 hypothetical protein psal_cds_1051 [Pandoravirus salinus]